MATDIKEYYPTKHITLIHSRQQLLNRFHPKLDEFTKRRFEELGIELILGDRAVIPSEGFPLDEGEFEVELKSGRKVLADFAVRLSISIREEHSKLIYSLFRSSRSVKPPIPLY